MRPTTRTFRRLTVLAVCAVALAGCGGQVAAPKNYGEINDEGKDFYGNLMYGCTGVEPNDDGEYVDVELAQPDFCTCLYLGLEETVPFDDTKKFDEAQAEVEDGEEIEVPSNIAKVQSTCSDDVNAYGDVAKTGGLASGGSGSGSGES